MIRLLVTAVLAAAALALVWLVLSSDRRAPSVEPVTAVNDASSPVEPLPWGGASAAVERRSVGDPAVEPDVDEAADEPSEDRRIRGFVLDEAGDPIPSASVRAFVDLGFGYNDWNVEDERSRPAEPHLLDADESDEDGAFTLDPRDLHVVTVEASIPGRPARQVAGCAPGARLEIVLGKGGTIEGSVTVAGEAVPVVDAEVRIFHGGDQNALERVRTDAGGRYRATGLHAGSGGVLVVPREYAMARYAPFELEPGATARVDVEVEAGWRLAGRVTDARTGIGIAGATVSAWDFIGKNVITDGRGDYALEGLRTRPGTVRVRANGYGAAEVAYEGQREDVDVVLEPGLDLVGRVVDESGAPIEASTVLAVGLRSEAGTTRREWKRATTSADGTFTIDSVRRDLDLVLQARAAGFGARVHGIPRATANVSELDVGDIRLRPQATIRGRVVQSDGSSVARASLVAVGPSGVALPDQTSFHVGNVDTTSDEDGGFFFAGLGAGTWTLWAHEPGGRSTQTVLDLDAGEERQNVVIRLPGGATLEGRVVDEQGRGISNAFVMAEATESEESARLAAQCDSAGAFRIEDVPEGPLVLGVSAPDPVDGEEERTRFLPRVLEGVAADGTFLTVQLDRLDGTVSGVVVDGSGEAVPLAYACIPLDGADSHSIYGVLADGEGRFELEVPSSGETRILAFPTRALRAGEQKTAVEWTAGRKIEDDLAGSATVRAGDREVRIRVGGS